MPTSSRSRLARSSESLIRCGLATASRTSAMTPPTADLVTERTVAAKEATSDRLLDRDPARGATGV